MAKNGNKKPAKAYDPTAFNEAGEGPNRRCHALDVRKLVTPGDNILRINGRDYVVGTDDLPAAMQINGSRPTELASNRGCICAASKELSLKSVAALANLVWRINSHATAGFGPNQTTDVGRLMRSGKVMTPAQIRAAFEAEKLDGITFEKLETPIVGAVFTEAAHMGVIKRMMMRHSSKKVDQSTTAFDRFAKDQDDFLTRTRRNFTTSMRVNMVADATPQGLTNAQTSIVTVPFYGNCNSFADFKKLTEFVVIVGLRFPNGSVETKKQARERVGAAVEAATPATPAKPAKKPAKPKATKPKATKPKATASKPAAKRTRKPAAAKPAAASKPASPATPAAPLRVVNAPTQPATEAAPVTTPATAPTTAPTTPASFSPSAADSADAENGND